MTSIGRSRRKPLSLGDVLRYSPHAASRSTVRRYYAKWRQENGRPPVCDLPDCVFHAAALVWKGKPLPLILDHSNGNNLDNSPSNLRYLCPNCDSQLPTRGGSNRGRVQGAEEGKYTLVSKEGKRNLYLLPEPAALSLKTYAPTVTITPNEPPSDASQETPLT